MGDGNASELFISAGTTQYLHEEIAHPANLVPVRSPLGVSSEKATPENGGVATDTKGQNSRKSSGRTRPSTRDKFIRESLGGKRRTIQGIKRRLKQFSIALKTGLKVCKSYLLSVRFRAYCVSSVKGSKPEKDPTPSASASSMADKLTTIPGEADFPQANYRRPLAQDQQETFSDTQAVATMNNADASHSAQDNAKRRGVVKTFSVSPAVGGDPNRATYKGDRVQDVGVVSPHQTLGQSPTVPNDVAAAGSLGTLRTDTSEMDENGAPSSSEPPERRGWKRSFHMVIHLARDDDGMRVACLDTGSDVDIISLSVVKSLQLPTEQYQGAPLKTSKDTYRPDWQVTFDWHVAKFHRYYTSTFAVLDEDHSGDFDILLGRKSDFYYSGR